MLREKVIEKALSYVGRKGWTMKSNWCARFVHDVMNEVGAGMWFYEGAKNDSCTSLMNFYKAHYPKQCDKDINKCKPGDLIFFQFDEDAKADHIGFFQTKKSSTKFTTVEGNTRLLDIGNQSDGNRVANRTRKTSQVMMFFHVDYENLPYPQPTRTLVKGNKGYDVKWLQFILKNLGYDISVDGSFGAKTENAFVVFQQINGLVVDKKCGGASRKRLLEEMEKHGINT